MPNTPHAHPPKGGTIAEPKKRAGRKTTSKPPHAHQQQQPSNIPHFAPAPLTVGMKNYARSNRNQARWQSVPVPLGRRRYSAPVGFQTITASPNARKPHSATGRADGLRSVPHQRLHPRTNPVRSVNLHWHTRSQTNTQTHPAYYPTLPIPRMAGLLALPQTHHPNAQQSLLGI